MLDLALLLLGILLFYGVLILVRDLSPSKKLGEDAEREVNAILARLSGEYHVMHDVLLTNGDSSTQIDHLVVSPYGIFCIETKGYRGWILGGEHAEYWTQSLPNRRWGTSQYQFYSPIRQNQGHVRYLSSLIRHVGSAPIIPIVVFSNTAEIMIDIREHNVIYISELYELIMTYNEVSTSTAEQQNIISIINQHRVYSRESQAIHIKRVHAKHVHSQSCINALICPRCGRRLVNKKGKYGAFIGCSGFPHCKMTMKL